MIAMVPPTASVDMTTAPNPTPANNTVKKCPPNIRTGSVPAPVLVSPISVAHGNTMAGSEGGKKGANWMRDQWVANLKKKRMTTGDSDASTTLNGSTTSVTVPVVKAGIRAEASRPANEKSRPKRTTKSKSAAAKAAAIEAAAAAASIEKEGLSLMQSAMLFQDLGCFELESPSFMRLTPTMRDGIHNGSLFEALPSPVQSIATATPTSTPTQDKTWMQPLLKKRSNCFSAELQVDPKRRTPRRQHSHSNSFDDSDETSSQQSYTSVGTPSNFHHNADVARMWGPELDFHHGYVDTFLDLPTPKSATMPHVTAGGTYLLSTPTALSLSKHTGLEQPRLVRTSSLEQEGLSQFFEQTTLGGEGGGANDPPLKPLKHQGFRTPRQAAASAVDEFFGKIMPSPAHYSFNSSRCFQPTPRGTVRLQHSGFEPKKPTGHGITTSTVPSTTASASASAEFDTLVQEYEFTDFDQELDSFYMDSMEAMGNGNDLDLISS